MKSPQAELEGLYAKSAKALDLALRTIVRGYVEPSAKAREQGLDDLSALIRATSIYSDTLGRYRVWREVDHAMTAGRYADPGDPGTWIAPEVPNVPFEEAYLDLVTREPRLAGSAKEVARLYSTEHAFAFAKKAELHVVDRIQKYLAESKRSGKREAEAVKVIEDLGDFTHAYARTIYRTNLATAYSAGRREQARDEVVQDLLPAFMFGTARDVDVRSGRPQDNGENHAALDGFLAPTGHAVWDAWSPPLSYQ